MVQVGTTKDRGLYNKPSAAVHPGALAAETLPQHSTVHPSVLKLKNLKNCWSAGKLVRDTEANFITVTVEFRRKNK